MAVSESQIKAQIDIINKQKSIVKDIMQLKISLDNYKEAIIATLKSVDQRQSTPELIRQIKNIEAGGMVDTAMIALGISGINVTYHQGRGKLLRTNYTVKRTSR